MSVIKGRFGARSKDLTFDDKSFLTVPSDPQARLWYRCRTGPTGFRLMVTPDGHRTFYLVYRARLARKGRAYRIGNAEDLSFREARSKAEYIRGLVTQGRDPVAEDQAVKSEASTKTSLVTIRDAVEYFIAANRPSLHITTIQAHEQTRDALPAKFMDTPAHEATPALFRSAVAQATTAPVMQNRHLSRLKAVLRFAFAENKIGTAPPLIAMKRPNPERKRTRTLTEEEIRALWPAADAAAAMMPRGGVSFAASVRLMLLLGTRLEETIVAHWSELDLDGSSPRQGVPRGQAMWYIPGEQRKGQIGNKHDLWVPLPPLAVSLLRELQAATGESPLVFNKAGYSSRTYMMGRLIAEMAKLGRGDHWTPHDLRRTCSTGLGDLSCPGEIIDLILGHVRRGVIGHYDVSQRVKERSGWLERWADRVSQIVGASIDKSGTAEKRPTLLHLYQTAGGLPEITAAREPDNGRRYLGAFLPLEAIKSAEEITRAALRKP